MVFRQQLATAVCGGVQRRALHFSAAFGKPATVEMGARLGQQTSDQPDQTAGADEELHVDVSSTENDQKDCKKVLSTIRVTGRVAWGEGKWMLRGGGVWKTCNFF